MPPDPTTYREGPTVEIKVSGDRVWDAVVIGGGPAGSVAACLLAQAGRSVLVVERDFHPREHVGESLTPSTNMIFERIGFAAKIEAAGFVRKPGAAWTAPTSPVGRYVDIRLAEFPMPGNPRPYTYNVERDVFDAMLLDHARESGATVAQGTHVDRVLFTGERATGVRLRVGEGTEDVHARFVIDASGRRCVLANQLGIRHPDPGFQQFGIFSWFEDVQPPPPGCEGMLWLHFLGLERAWAWMIPLRNGIWSVGFVTDKQDFIKAGVEADDYVASLVERNLNLAHGLAGARRVRPWRTEGDYTYRIDRLSGPGWLLVGDALRFVDPVFSTGVDVATYSAMYAAEAIDLALDGGEEAALAHYVDRVSGGVEAWYRLISLFYGLQNLFTYFAVHRATREKVVRILQGNLYEPDALGRALDMIGLMEDAHARMLNVPGSLLRPGALTPQSA